MAFSAGFNPSKAFAAASIGGDCSAEQVTRTSVQDLPSRHQDEVVKELSDVRVGLMDGERDCASLSGNGLESAHDSNCDLRVEPAGRFVQK